MKSAVGRRALSRLAAVDLNLLVALDALLEDVNVTRAGRRIGLSQPAMSHALGRLRELLQDPLLVREGRVLRRTAVAERIGPEVQRLLGEIEVTLLGQGPFVPQTSQRTFRITTNDYCGAVLLPRLLSRMRRAAPRSKVQVHAHAGPAPAAELLRGELELGIGVFLELDPELRTQTLFEESFVCVLRGALARGHGRLTLARYLELEHLLVSAPSYGSGVVDSALERQGLQRRVVLRIPHFLVAPPVLAETDLVATLPERVARAMAPSYGLRIVPVPLEVPTFSVQQVWHSRRDADPASIWLRAEVLAAAGSLKVKP